LESALDNINIVPNPYYAFSAYETNKLDNRVKITNLPYVCTVTIYDLNGTMIRQFKKGDPTTSIDWDLKNQKNVPIASGAYIIHVNVPDVGEKVLKWFGVMRPIDLDSF
jgi:flagellar hook assembly protein FlgD